MRKISKLLLFASLAVAVPVVLASCKDDDPEIKILSAIAGDYNGEEACTPGSPYLVHIYNTSDQPNKVFVDNAFGLGERFLADVNGNSFTIPPSPIEAPSASGLDTTYIANLSATGTITGDILKMDVKIEAVTGAGDNAYELPAGACVFTGDRAYRNPPVGNGL